MTKPDKKLPAGYTCKCGKFNKFPSYVYAHWHEELTHTCDCGKKHKILRGDYWPVKKGAKK